MSETRRGRKRGPHSEETKQKIAAALRGKKGYVRTEEHREAARERMVAKWNEEDYRAHMLEAFRSEEYRKKQSLGSTGRPQSPEQRQKIAQKTKESWTAERRAKMAEKRKGIHSRTIDPDGYVMLSGYGGHPLALNGRVREHRLVLWEKLGSAGAACEWCGAPLAWKSAGKDELVVDHLNFDKQDNRDENLVPSCRGCNTAREKT